MKRILLVKTSSMGDVIHNLPIVADIRARYPEAAIDWVVEDAFAEIPAMHPGISRVIPVALRRWRKHPHQRRTWQELRRFLQGIRQAEYDCVLDTQCLLKSALIARLAHGPRTGLDWRSAREPLASMLYQYTFAVDPTLHAVERYRLLARQALNLPADLPLDYGLRAPAIIPPWLPDQPYIVLLHATSRDEKLWPNANWIALGKQFAEAKVLSILPWGNVAEYERAQTLAEAIPGALVAPRLTLTEAAAMLARARAVIGVDTGLVHLATALSVPSVGIYCGSDPGKNGLYARSPIRNLGGPNLPPSVADVASAVAQVCA